MKPPFEVKAPRNWQRMDKTDEGWNSHGWILHGGIPHKEGYIATFFPDGLTKEIIEKKKTEFLQYEQKHGISVGL